MNGVWLTKNTLRNLLPNILPLFVLSDNLRSFFAAGIKRHEHGNYNHFMVMHRTGFFASQDWIFREVPAEKYLEYHRLKFWTNKEWKKIERKLLIRKIKRDLEKAWWRRIYDPLAIVGQAINQEWIQIPGIDICSDKGRYLKYVDYTYNLKYPSPSDVNKWFQEKEQEKRKYRVFGRYSPD